jgi:hypothetical protein
MGRHTLLVRARSGQLRRPYFSVRSCCSCSKSPISLLIRSEVALSLTLRNKRRDCSNRRSSSSFRLCSAILSPSVHSQYGKATEGFNVQKRCGALLILSGHAPSTLALRRWAMKPTPQKPRSIMSPSESNSACCVRLVDVRLGRIRGLRHKTRPTRLCSLFTWVGCTRQRIGLLLRERRGGHPLCARPPSLIRAFGRCEDPVASVDDRSRVSTSQ